MLAGNGGQMGGGWEKVDLVGCVLIVTGRSILFTTNRNGYQNNKHSFLAVIASSHTWKEFKREARLKRTVADRTLESSRCCRDSHETAHEDRDGYLLDQITWNI